MQNSLNFILMFSLISCCYASDSMDLSEESLKKINHENFSSPRLKIKETPSILKHSESFEMQDEIAFEERTVKEDLDFPSSHLDEINHQVAEEDFILKDNKIKNTEPKEKKIKFSRTPL